MTIIWLILLLAGLMIEMLLTMGEMTALTLAIGSSGAFISSLLQAPVWLQLSIWGGSSLLALLFLRPFLRRYFTPLESDFTAQSFAGQFGKVIEAIEPHQKGRVQINGETWFASSLSSIPAGAEIVIVEVDGTTLHVIPADDLHSHPSQLDLKLAERLSEGESKWKLP